MESWSFPPRYDDAYTPPADQDFWFPERETMDPDARDARILERLREVCAYALERSPFYRARWGDFDPRTDLGTLEEFERLPVIKKDELRTDQAEHPPFGSYTCIEPADVVRVHGTSGTTGRPTAFGIGRDDWRAIANAHARIMWGMGIRPADTVFIGSVFSLYMGSWATLSGAERLGAAAFPFGAGVAGQSQRAVNWMAQMRPGGLLRHAVLRAATGRDRRRGGHRPARLRHPDPVLLRRARRVDPEHPRPDRGALRRQGLRLRLDGRDDAVDEPRRVQRPGRDAVLAGRRLHRGLRSPRPTGGCRSARRERRSTRTSSARASR